MFNIERLKNYEILTKYQNTLEMKIGNIEAIGDWNMEVILKRFKIVINITVTVVGQKTRKN